MIEATWRSPAAHVTAGSANSISASWQNLAPDLYLGGVAHFGVDQNGDLVTTDNFGDPLITLVDVDATQGTTTP